MSIFKNGASAELLAGALFLPLAEYLNGFAADHKKVVSVTEIKDVTDTLFWCVCFVRMLPDWRILRYAAHDEKISRSS